MSSVFHLGALFLSIVSATTSDPKLGQEDLRQRWIESTNSEELMQQYFLIDIAEGYWQNHFKKNAAASNIYTPSKDVKVSGYQARKFFAESPWTVKNWVSSLAQYLKNMTEHPFDAFAEFHSWFVHFIEPLVFALILVLIFHLWIWAPAICKDFPRWFGSRSKLLLFVILTSMFVSAAVTGLWAFFCFILLCFSTIYSRQRNPLLVLSLLFAFYFNISGLLSIVATSAGNLSALEALKNGRTRLEYSSESLNQLGPLEKALWADYNGNLKEANAWADKLEPSIEKSILLTNLAESKATASDLLGRYEKLQKEFGDDPVILFNLSQLYIRTQQLIQADQMRGKLNPDFYAVASATAAATSRLLVPPALKNDFDAFSENVSAEVSVLMKTSGIKPFVPSKGLFTLFQLLFPWILVALAVVRRNSASGVCLQTNEPTSSPEQPYSSLYLSVTQKKDSTNHSVRQKLDLLTRRAAQLQQAQTRAWKWIFPGVSSLVLDQNLGLTYLKTALPILFFWNSISASFRNTLLQIFHLSFQPAFEVQPLSLGFLILFLASYLLFLQQNISRVNS